jgi:predicted nucleotidyltransferase
MPGTGYDIRTKKGRVKRKVLDDVLRRVVDAARPDKIILFGSAARGEMGPHSDLDLLVIKGGKFNRRRLTAAINRRLRGTGAAVDVVVVTPEEVERYRDTHCLVICPALREGKVVYGSEAPASG